MNLNESLEKSLLKRGLYLLKENDQELSLKIVAETFGLKTEEELNILRKVISAFNTVDTNNLYNIIFMLQKIDGFDKLAKKLLSNPSNFNTLMNINNKLPFDKKNIDNLLNSDEFNFKAIIINHILEKNTNEEISKIYAEDNETFIGFSCIEETRKKFRR